MLELLGLRDDYSSQGRVLTEMLDPSATAAALRTPAALELGRVYKQLEAPVGEFGTETLRASTGALAAGDPGDAVYDQCNSKLKQLGEQRDAVAAPMQTLLGGAEFGHQDINPSKAHALAAAGAELLRQAIATAEFCS